MGALTDVRVFFDSGAHSLYNKFSRAEVMRDKEKLVGASAALKKYDTYDYVKAPEYLAFRERFAEFVKANDRYIDTYPNLDVINNGELTYKNQKWLEKQGCRPIPVWHVGVDEKWLLRYLDEGYEYIALGGAAFNPPPVMKTSLDAVWRRLLTDKDGMPKVKVHGFAITSLPLMPRYPWYSVDSKTWISHAQFGGVIIPSLDRFGKRDPLHPIAIKVCYQTLGRVAPQRHVATMDQSKRRYVLNFLKEINIPLGVSEYKTVKAGYELREGEQFIKSLAQKSNGRDRVPSYRRKAKEKAAPTLVEVIKEPGIVNTLFYRLDVNAYLFRAIEAAIPPWPWRLSPRIKFGKRGLLS